MLRIKCFGAEYERLILIIFFLIYMYIIYTHINTQTTRILSTITKICCSTPNYKYFNIISYVRDVFSTGEIVRIAGKKN